MAAEKKQEEFETPAFGEDAIVDSDETEEDNDNEKDIENS